MSRLLIHDFAGHSFQIQLSRALARRGHQVLHLYGAANPTPKGPLAVRADDPATLTIQAVTMAGGYDRYRFFTRWRQERAYGRQLAVEIENWRPDTVISANTPLDAQAAGLAACRRIGAKFFFWLQDLTGEAAWLLLKHRWGGLGRPIGAFYRHWERRIARDSTGVVAISPDFAPYAHRWGVADQRLAIIENWAPLDDMPRLEPQDPLVTAWAAGHGLSGRRIFLYSGMMGLKHRYQLLADLARHYGNRPEVAVVVVSQGLGRDRLAAIKASEGLDNLYLFDFQPFAQVPAMMAAADVLIATLEADAGILAVPSKVLAYLCAGRPLLAAIPAANLAARRISENQAGIVVDAGVGDERRIRDAFLAGADTLLASPAATAIMGDNARRYAETAFAIDPIADRFASLLLAETKE